MEPGSPRNWQKWSELKALAGRMETEGKPGRITIHFAPGGLMQKLELTQMY